MFKMNKIFESDTGVWLAHACLKNRRKAHIANKVDTEKELYWRIVRN